jgi:hypothetical protein
MYQAVKLIALLEGDGTASTRGVAKTILDRDESQIEYYDKIVGNTIGRVLRGHGLAKREGNDYSLNLDHPYGRAEGTVQNVTWLNIWKN